MTDKFEYYVSFAIYDFEMDPQEISSMLNLKPDIVGLAGEKVELASGKTVVLRNTVWELKSTLPVNRQLDEHVTLLLKQLNQRKETVKKLSEKYELHIKIGAYFYSVNSGFMLTRDKIKEIAELGMAIDLDCYYLES